MSNGDVGFSKLTGPMQMLVLFLTALGVIVPAVLGFVNLDKRQDMLEETTSKHIIKDEIKWEKIDDEMDTLTEKSHLLEISIKEQAVQFSYIRKELESLNIKMDHFEVE